MFGKDDHPINYKKIFSDYLCVTFYVLKKRPLKDAAEREMITNKMTRIMTGVANTEYGKKKMSKGALASHEKRTNDGLRRTKGHKWNFLKWNK